MSKKKCIILIQGIFIIILILTAVMIWHSNKPIKPEKRVTEQTTRLNETNKIKFEEFEQNDFTCTGLTYDKCDDSFWIADYGNNNNDQQLHPRLIEVNKDFTQTLNIIEVDQIKDDEFDLQGIAYDICNDSLWMATGKFVIEINKTGKILSKISMGNYSKYKSNGIAVDKDNIWVLCYNKFLLKLNKYGDIEEKYKFNYKDQDHIYLINNNLYVTIGADYLGDNNFVFKYNLKSGIISCEYQLEDSHAIEGIVILDDTLYIANDGKFHHDIFNCSYINIYSLK